MEFEIRLSSVRQVQDFVSLATSRSFSVIVGSPNHWVNGKSFMEMFCLNLREFVTVRPDCSQEEFETFRAEALAITG
jgi:hypothetical protein